MFKALVGFAPSQAPKKEKREAKKEVVPKNEADKENEDTLLDERLTSVDWDDDAALKKLTNEVLKQYLKQHKEDQQYKEHHQYKQYKEDADEQ